MYSSSNYSYLALRLGLATVFLWFGIDKFIHPSYWLNAWLPTWSLNFLTKTNLSGVQFIYALGAFETLIGLSMILGIFEKLFSLLAIILLVAILIINGLSEVTIRDFGLIGAFLAVVFWPVNRHRF